MSELDFLKFITNNGIAAACLFYFMFRFNGTLDKLTGSIDRLNADIDRKLGNIDSRQAAVETAIRELRLELSGLKGA